MGVFADKPIGEDDWQIIYGKVVEETTPYCFEGNFEPYAPFRFLNHSCVPNCEVTCDEDGVYYLTALCEIDADEELTIDYGEHPCAKPDTTATISLD